MDLQLTGKRFLVTGGSRGIGKSIVQHLLDEGAHVAFTARGQEGIDAALADFGAGDRVRGDAIDSSDHQALIDWTNDRTKDWDGLDGVVSNTSASGGQPIGLEGWKIQVETDLYGASALVDTAIPHLVANGGGSVVQISTITAIEHHDFPGNPSYGAIKAALIRYMGELAIQYGKGKVRANTVSPGPIWVDGGVWEFVKDNMPDYYNRDVEAHPQKRLGTADEVAKAVTFLSSDAAAGWITGQNICVDGGFTRGISF